MTVVMGIIAIIMTLGATALIKARDDAVLDGAAEELLATIREAQNRAISIQSGSVGDTKAWGIRVNSAGKLLSLESYYLSGVTLVAQPEQTVNENFSKITSVLVETTTSGVLGRRPQGRIIYSTPFGTVNGCFDATVPTWSVSNKTTREWTATCNRKMYPGGSESYYKFLLNYKNKIKIIRVTRGGDAYIE